MKSILLEKEQIRKLIQRKRREMSELELENLSSLVLFNLEQSDIFTNAKCIFIYHSLLGEVSTRYFLERWKHQKHFYLPIVKGEDIFFREYTSEKNMLLSKYGILEPTGEDVDVTHLDIDMIVVPGVAFDHNCNRMGYGKGYYDRFLKNIKTIKVGICFNFQLFNIIPVNEEDIPMDYIITEKGIIKI